MKLLYPWICVAASVALGLIGVVPLTQSFPVEADGGKDAAAVSIYLVSALMGAAAAYLDWHARSEPIPEKNALAFFLFRRGIAGALGVLLALTFVALAIVAAMT